eukprot:Nitzschia sp. Nitz4//scaffold83_size84149//29340//30605//NITZ4_005170-RA/size84149-processed-gene-0.72-mRNA-1//1//CDS//3329558935//550//frame0
MPKEETTDRDDADLEGFLPSPLEQKARAHSDEMTSPSPPTHPVDNETHDCPSKPLSDETHVPATLTEEQLHEECDSTTSSLQEPQKTKVPLDTGEALDTNSVVSNTQVREEDPKFVSATIHHSEHDKAKETTKSTDAPRTTSDVKGEAGEVVTQPPVSDSLVELSYGTASDESSYGDHSFISWLLQLCALFSLLVLFSVGVGFAIDSSNADRDISTMAPSQMPSISSSSESPTSSLVTISTVYPIRVNGGKAENITTMDYEADLIQSMDILCLLVETNLTEATKRTQPTGITTVLPTSIREFRIVPCPIPLSNSSDRCEIVIAEILLEHAQDNWRAFLNALNLAMTLGQLQVHLDIVNPNSAVDILRLDEMSIVTATGIIPTTGPTQEPTVWPSQSSIYGVLTPTNPPSQTRFPLLRIRKK